jgi:alpha-L-fucosidase
MKMRYGCLAMVMAMFFISMPVAGEDYVPSQSNIEAREWFRNARFGLFVHWGVYSVLERGEWTLHRHKMTLAEYEKLPARFNPTKFDPKEWVSMVKRAGMRYITITSKHHDGFAMFDSKVTDWDMVDATPYGKDVLKMLADECRRQGVKLFFYHSHLDWHHPDYYPRGRTGQLTGRPESGDFNAYLDFMNGQLEELLGGRYGDVAGIWFDGWWDQRLNKLGNEEAGPRETQVDWRLRETYDLIHRLQPAAMIGNNHHVGPFPGEDFQMFERDLPGQNTAGHSGDSVIGALPLETCTTINRSWGYNAEDKEFKSLEELVHLLVRAAGLNTNLLLNVGPMPTGEIQPECVERLEAMGKWMDQYGESVYGTRGGPFGPEKWGAATHRGKTVYLHVMNWDEGSVSVPTMGRRIMMGSVLTGGSLEMRETSGHWKFNVPEPGRDPIDTIIRLQMDKPVTP